MNILKGKSVSVIEHSKVALSTWVDWSSARNRRDVLFVNSATQIVSFELKLFFFLFFSCRSCFSSLCPLNSMTTFWAPSHTIMCPWDFAHSSWTRSMNDQSLAGWQKKSTNQEENHCGTTWIYRRARLLFITTSCFHQTSTRYARWWITFFSREGAAITRGSVSVLIMQKPYSICSVWANPFCLYSILLNKPFGSLITIFWVILVTSRVTFKLKVKYAFKLRCTSGGEGAYLQFQ